MSTHLRIATRNSALALWQANEVKRLLHEVEPSLQIELVPLSSDGDIQSAEGFAHFGYKGIFTKRIEAALLDGSADIAVHSMKDVHSEIPDALTIAATLEREDPRDAFLSEKYVTLEAMPAGSIIGTASVRRQAIIHHLRPDLKVVPFRGNVPTRLEKLQRGEVDATFLAVAGLKRLGLESHITQFMTPDTMPPAVAQGAIGIECRRADNEIMTLLKNIAHAPTFHAVTAERAMLAILDGDCKTPLCGFAEIDGEHLSLTGKWIAPDGSYFHSVSQSGSVQEADSIGACAGQLLKQAMESES